jgi:mannose-6-phosphate isomerase-like protein (cupin superfamily)
MPTETFAYEPPKKPSFSRKGFDGFHFPLKDKNLEAFLVESKKGHDEYVINKKSTHLYFVIDGEGTFEIEGRSFPVVKDMLIEVPPNNEFCYFGKMRLLVLMNPPFSDENQIITRKNPWI